MKTILNIGTLPLPLGGVTIHLERLFLKINESSISKNVFLWDYKRESIFTGLYKIITSNIIHIHLSNKYFRLLIILLCKFLFKKTIVTYHGNYNFKNIFDLFSLHLSYHNFVLNNFSYKNATSKTKNSRRVQVISAFIPPSSSEVLSIESSEIINIFLNKYSFNACTNAHSYVLNNEKKDLYGIDFLLKMFVELPNYGLIIADPSKQLSDIYKGFIGIENILFITKPEPFIEIICKTDVFIRATTTDGDSLSVKEAIYIGKKVLASNCVDRPEGCTLFSMYDKIDFINKLHIIKESKYSPNSSLVDGSAQLINFYNIILN